jgi:phosphoglucosamine mutase
VAWESASRGVAGAIISASHNPYHDNGIKLFGPGGVKLREEVEREVQVRYLELARHLLELAGGAALDGDVGPGTSDPSVIAGWIDSIVGSVASRALDGLHLVIDCAHGAAYAVAPQIFRELGADVTVIGDEPTGTNINDGVGSTNPNRLIKAVLSTGADAGLAFDGDADRLIAIGHDGHVIDGDRVIGLLALDWAAGEKLRDETVVVTVMTNLGFHRAMAASGIKVLTTAVGDRHVLAALDDYNLSLGGEQSGHVICRDLSTTGDGVLAGVQLLDATIRQDGLLSDLAEEAMETVPQVLRNVTLPTRDPDAAEAIAEEVEEVAAAFGDDGRVVVRPSGTEPLLRIMVEHVDQATAKKAADDLVAAAERIFA